MPRKRLPANRLLLDGVRGTGYGIQTIMNTETKNKTHTSETKPGLFKRIFTKLDDSMKTKADAAAKDSCCSVKDGKGNKCC